MKLKYIIFNYSIIQVDVGPSGEFIISEYTFLVFLLLLYFEGLY